MSSAKKFAAVILSVLSVAGLVLALLGIYRYTSYKSGIVEPLREDLITRTRDAAARIDASLAPAREAADALAGKLSDRNVTAESELTELLRQTVIADDSIYGSAIAYEPNGFQRDRRLYAPYLAKKNGELAFLHIEDEYDYTLPEWEWYGTALEQGPRWTEPYFDTSVGDILMTTYSAVFYRPDSPDGRQVPRGVATVDISMNVIRDIVRSLDLGGMGYSALLSREGKFLYHPDPEIVLSGIALTEFAGRTGDVELMALAERILAGQGGISDYVAPLTGLDSWFVHEPVASTGWSLVSIFVKDDIPIEATVLRQWQIVIGAGLVLFVVNGSAVALGILAGRRKRLWIFSVVTSLALLAGIGFTWRVSLKYESTESSPGRISNDIAGLEAFKESSARLSEERLTDPPLFLPTGVFIDSMRFVTRTDVEIRGYVWQKYDPRIHAGIDRGFMITGVAHFEVGDPLSEDVAGTEVVRWPFEAAQRVRFDYSKFPLMRERIELQLIPRELSRSIVLVPDLESYEILSPAARPGLDDVVYLPGWDVSRSFFELRDNHPRTDFGIGGATLKDRHPSLYFNVEIRKNFVDTFVSNLVPLIIVGIVVFLVLMIMSNDDDRIFFLRTGTGFNLSICATLLFVVVFAHIGARQKIATQEIIYLEYFYIVMYFAILWVAANAILMILKPEPWITRYEENLLSRVFFWPITLGALWLATLGTFY